MQFDLALEVGGQVVHVAPDTGSRVSKEVTFDRGDLSVCPLRGFTGACEHLISNWRGVPQGPPQGQTLLLLRGTSALH